MTGVLRKAARLGLTALLALLPAALAAQVGHRPESSPYRDIRKGHTVTPYFGQFGGSGGRFEIGPHDGNIYGLRYDLRTGSTIQIGLAVARADLQRLIVDPFDSLSRRVSGPVDQTVTFAEANLQLNLTGAVRRRRGRSHLSQRRPRRHQQVRARQEDLPGPHHRGPDLRHRPAVHPR